MENELTNEWAALKFLKLAKKFYCQNFGTMSKSDFELFMFHAFEESHSVGSDWDIAKQLGITVQRVRNLKMKSRLVNPQEYDWRGLFKGLLKTAVMDKSHENVKILVKDPFLYAEIENFLETKNSFIDVQLNPKILMVSKKSFVLLLVEIETDEKKKKKLEKLLLDGNTVEAVYQNKWDVMDFVKNNLKSIVFSLPEWKDLLSAFFA